jgi:hypothetical protein
MTVTATIIADSISPQGIRLTTFQLRFPRFILAQFNTHRMFSRNASSSRAIPTERLLADIERDPAKPINWGKNQPGMHASEELSGLALQDAVSGWDDAMRGAVAAARFMSKLGAHKEIVNRLVEPFSHINVVCSATEFSNWYALRRHPDAQPEIQRLANAMWEAQQASTPKKLKHGKWHLPYTSAADTDGVYWHTAPLPNHEIPAAKLLTLQKISTARCARVSYLTHDGRPTTVQEDVALADKLLASVPLHASPAEHQATPDVFNTGGWQNENQHGNYDGWRQFRKTLPNESQ